MRDPAERRRGVVACCYLGMFIQAMVINLAPLLFVPLKAELGLSFEQVGRLILINFLTQMLADLACCALADRVSVRLLTVLANALACVGLCWFALGSRWHADPYDGLVAGTVIFSIGCGLLEVLLSPIINAVPSARKAGAMALLHAFYPIGKVAVILVTGITLHLWGAAHWRWIMLGWAVVPLLNTLAFLGVGIPSLAEPATRSRLRDLVGVRAYGLAVLALAFAGASEVTLAQWTSTFAELGLGLSKVVADLVGFGLFGAGMIAGRLWFGLKGEDLDLHRLMLRGSLGSAAMCVVISLAPWPALSLAAGAFAGFFVSMLWPGVVSLAAARFPLAGASMFAFLAAGGDAGAGLMPWLLGVLADRVAALDGLAALPGLAPEQLGLRAGILVTALCPLVLAALLRRLHRIPAPSRSSL